MKNRKKLVKILLLSAFITFMLMFSACVTPPQALTVPTNVRIVDGVLMWDEVEGADEYIVYTSYDGEEVTVKTNEYDLYFIQEEGQYQIEVAAVKQEKKGKTKTEWVAVNYYNYDYLKELTFTKIEGREAYEVTKKKNAKLESTVVIPETYNGLPVVRVAESAFCDDIVRLYFNRPSQIDYSNYTIQKIVLPDTIEEIGGGAFACCMALKEVNIPEGVKNIGYRTFFYCPSLSNIILPSTLERLSKSAFETCPLNEITIPENVKEIGEVAFGYCINLKQIKLPEQVTVVSDKLFYGCSSLQKVELSEKTESIGESAFQNCTALSKITLPQTITSIGNYAFYGCTVLSDITFPINIISVGKECFKNSAWYNSLPDGLIIINGKYLYEYKGSVPDEEGKIIVPRYVEKLITESPFIDSKAKSIIFECELDEIPEGLFSNCLYLEEVVLKGNIKNIPKSTFALCHSLTKVVLPDGVENIGERAFDGTKIKNLDFLPSSVKTIEKGAFSQSSLESANLPKNAVITGSGVFFSCRNLTSANIYSGTYLPKSTFMGCVKLTDVTLNEGMEEIQSMAFSYCAIKNLDFLPSTIKIIGKSAFTDCPLEEIRYPKELQSTENIFGKNTSVKTHILPVFLTEIAFYVQAENLYYEGTQDQFESTEKTIKNSVDTSTITIYYYAEREDDIDDISKNYWHYDSDGKTPVVWEL